MHRSDSSNGRVHTSAAKKLPTAYQAAKERLERKYAGVRRQIAVNLEELDQFCPIRSRNVRDFEKVTDLLNIIVINLTEAGREEELGNEYLYIQVQKKMTESMLADYRRWLFDKSKPETVQSSRQCPIRETEFLTITAETIKGLGPLKIKIIDNSIFLFGENQQKDQKKSRQKCPECEEQDAIWRFNQFKSVDVKIRWISAEKNRLCCRCFGPKHLGNSCQQKGKCNINGYEEIHNQLLHEEALVQNAEDKNQPIDESKVKHTDRRIQWRELVNTTGQFNTKIESRRVMLMALRTVSVKLRNGNRGITVNSLLDDGSTKSYIISHIAAELGLDEPVEIVTVSTMNGNIKTFQTTRVECEVGSIDWKVRQVVSTHSTQKVTGKMRPIEWRVHGKNWPHLKYIKFSQLAPCPMIDIYPYRSGLS